MSANLNFSRGKASLMLGNNTPAWHGYGTLLPGLATSKEAIEFAGLDYSVGKKGLIFNPNEGTGLGEHYMSVPNKYVTYREENNCPFGIVGKNYEVIQNSEAFTFFDAIVGEGAAIYETAGALGNGETIFITAKLPDHIKVNGEDIIEKYLFLTMSHDGLSSIKTAMTPTRIVCQNTLNIALNRNDGIVSIRHNKNAKDNLVNAHKLLKLSNKLFDSLGSMLNVMTKIKITDKDLRNYIDNIFPGTRDEDGKLSTKGKNIQLAVYDYHKNGPGQDYYPFTAYSAYNSVTGYFQNVKKAGLDCVLGTPNLISQKAFELSWKLCN